VTHRQEGEPLVTFAQVQERTAVDDLEEDVAVADHRPLGRAGGPRGVDEDGELVAPHRGDCLLPGERMRRIEGFAAGEKRREALAHRVGEVAQPLHVENDDALERGAPLADLQRLVELLLVLDEEHLAQAVAQQVLDLRRRVGRVDPGRDAADPENAEIGEDPFRDGLGQDTGDLSGAKAHGTEPHPHGAGAGAERGPVHRPPDAAILAPQDGAGTARRHPVQQHRGDAGADGRVLAVPARAAAGIGPAPLGSGRGQRHSFFFFQRRRPRIPTSFWPR